jgi:hypothetical protein
MCFVRRSDELSQAFAVRDRHRGGYAFRGVWAGPTRALMEVGILWHDFAKSSRMPFGGT